MEPEQVDNHETQESNTRAVQQFQRRKHADTHEGKRKQESLAPPKDMLKQVDTHEGQGSKKGSEAGARFQPRGSSSARAAQQTEHIQPETSRQS